MFEKTGGRDRELPVHYTGKNIHATAGSRTAIDDDLEVGMVVVLDPYQHDGAEEDINGNSGAKPINVTRPQTSFLNMKKFVVVAVSPRVNEIPTASAATQRRGGMVSVVEAADDIQALVDGTTDVAVGDVLEATNGSFNLTKRAALTTVSTTLTFAYAGTPDYAITNAAPSNTAAGFAFFSNDEFGGVLTVLANTQARATELESRLTSGICAVAVQARSTNSAGLTRVNFNGSSIR